MVIIKDFLPGQIMTESLFLAIAIQVYRFDSVDRNSAPYYSILKKLSRKLALFCAPFGNTAVARPVVSFQRRDARCRWRRSSALGVNTEVGT